MAAAGGEERKGDDLPSWVKLLDPALRVGVVVEKLTPVVEGVGNKLVSFNL